MTTTEQAFVEGFLKRATDYGISEADAVKLAGIPINARTGEPMPTAELAALRQPEARLGRNGIPGRPATPSYLQKVRARFPQALEQAGKSLHELEELHHIFSH